MASLRIPRGAQFTLAATDDLDGDDSATGPRLNLDGAAGVIIMQSDSSAGADGTAGIDVIQISHDDGETWVAATAANLGTGQGLVNSAGAAVTNAALNAAGVEPVGGALFSAGPFDGPILMRCVRKAATDANSAAWVTTAPSVVAIKLG